MTSTWSHGWACDVVYLLRTRTAPRHEVCTYVAQCLPAFCVSPCRTARTASHCSAVQGCNRKWAVRIADLLGVQTRLVATWKYPFHYRSIQSQITALVSLSD